MPYPSAACQTCKIRRIKCDEGRPICQRCKKSRRICIEAGPAKQISFSIHVENSFAAGKTKRPRGPRSSLTVMRPEFDLETRAIAYYLQEHLSVTTDIPVVSGCMGECIAAWKISGQICPMVDLALSSIALAVFSKIQHHPPALVKAASTYHRLLQLAQKQVQQIRIRPEDRANIDSCLLAIFIMGRYEGVILRPDDVNASSSFGSMRKWYHHDGAMAILKFWSEYMSDDIGTFIVKQTRKGLIRSSLLRGLPLPDWLLDGKRFGEHGMELDYDRIIVRITNLHHLFMDSEEHGVPNTMDFEDLDKELQELDKALESWASRYLGSYSHWSHVLEEFDLRRKDFYSSIVYSYSRSEHAVVWSDYYASRILINSTRLRFLNLKNTDSSPESNNERPRLECITNLKKMADNLASTVPFCLARFKVESDQTSVTLAIDTEVKPYLASSAVWPLTIASSAEGIDFEQQRWFRSGLARLGRLLGDGALECATTNAWGTI